MSPQPLPAFTTPLFLPAQRLTLRTLRLSSLTRRRFAHHQPAPSHLVLDERRCANNATAWVSPRRRVSPTMAQAEPHAQATARLLDGKATAATVRAEIADEVTALVAEHGEAGRPGLAVVIVGDRKDSATYVRSKHKACEKAGIRSVGVTLSAEVSQDELESVVEELNARDDLDGILVQLPLPGHIDEDRVLSRIAVEKDVDGFHPANMGRLCMSGREPPLAVPCTPKGCMELLDRYAIDPSGKSAVVIGRSNIVGLPIAMMLMHRNATVSICHSRTRDTEQRVRDADIVVAACGRAGFVKGEWIKPGAVVIDIGINAVDDPSRERGYRLVGDVEFEACSEKAAWITPVPGGVGPMTIAMLLSNTIAAKKRHMKA